MESKLMWRVLKKSKLPHSLEILLYVDEYIFTNIYRNSIVNT